MSEGGEKRKRGRFRGAKFGPDNSLFMRRMREAEEAALRATAAEIGVSPREFGLREIAPVQRREVVPLQEIREPRARISKTSKPEAPAQVVPSSRRNKTSRVVLQRSWTDPVAELQRRFPEITPTPKMLVHGTAEERALYYDLKRAKQLSLLTRYKPYGDPIDYLAKNYPGKTIGQIQEINPNFVNYCRYHKIEHIMDGFDRNPWEGREEEAFREKWGNLKPGKVAGLGKEGHRDYMRLRRARKKKKDT